VKIAASDLGFIGISASILPGGVLPKNKCFEKEAILNDGSSKQLAIRKTAAANAYKSRVARTHP